MREQFNETNFKALLYAVPLFLTPFADKLGAIMFDGYWPTSPQVVACTIVGLINTFFGLRAFYDGSYERSRTERKTDSP